jgi:hypothetical protein
MMHALQVWVAAPSLVPPSVAPLELVLVLPLLDELDPEDDDVDDSPEDDDVDDSPEDDELDELLFGFGGPASAVVSGVELLHAAAKSAATLMVNTRGRRRACW